jgi:hypothetical protein
MKNKGRIWVRGSNRISSISIVKLSVIELLIFPGRKHKTKFNFEENN